MIELKLRVWNPQTKTMQPVKYLRWLANGNIASIGCGDETGFQERLRPRDCVLMRYTGLKDKNGRDIYEGDILDQIIDGDRYRYECLWGNGQYLFSGGRIAGKPNDGRDGGDGAPIQTKELEVVGDIHKNPELLENL